MNDTDAILYGRFSERPNAELARSLDIQDQLGRDYALAHGLAIVRELGDKKISARKVPLADRPGGRELLRLVGPKKVRHVIVYKLDRIFRSIEDGLPLLRRWTRQGIALHCVAEPGCSVDTSTPTGFFMVAMRLLVAEFEALQTADRTSQSMRKLQANGYLMGTLEYGKRLTGEVEVVKLADGKEIRRKLTEPDPAEQAVIGRMLHWRAQGVSYNEIARRLNAERIPSRGRTLTTGEHLAGWQRQVVKRIILAALQRERVGA